MGGRESRARRVGVCAREASARGGQCAILPSPPLPQIPAPLPRRRGLAGRGRRARAGAAPGDEGDAAAARLEGLHHLPARPPVQPGHVPRFSPVTFLYSARSRPPVQPVTPCSTRSRPPVQPGHVPLFNPVTFPCSTRSRPPWIKRRAAAAKDPPAGLLWRCAPACTRVAHGALMTRPPEAAPSRRGRAEPAGFADSERACWPLGDVLALGDVLIRERPFPHRRLRRASPRMRRRLIQREREGEGIACGARACGMRRRCGHALVYPGAGCSFTCGGSVNRLCCGGPNRHEEVLTGVSGQRVCG